MFYTWGPAQANALRQGRQGGLCGACEGLAFFSEGDLDLGGLWTEKGGHLAASSTVLCGAGRLQGQVAKAGVCAWSSGQGRPPRPASPRGFFCPLQEGRALVPGPRGLLTSSFHP